MEKSFVFKDIPAYSPRFPRRPFVFNEIRASFVHSLKLLLEQEGVSNGILSVPTKESALFLGVSLVIAGPPVLLS